MANIFIGGDEIAKKSELRKLTGEIAIKDSLDNYLEETAIHGTQQLPNTSGYPSNGWGTVVTFHGIDKVVQLFADDTGTIYIRSGWTKDILNGKRQFLKIPTSNDVNALQSQINDLKKQIGGVLSSLLSHITDYATSTVMEVA